MKLLVEPSGFRSSCGTDIDAHPCASPMMTRKFGGVVSAAAKTGQSMRKQNEQTRFMAGKKLRLTQWRPAHIEIWLGVPSLLPIGLFDLGSEDDGVVQSKFIGPDELGSFKIILEIRLLGIDLLH